MKYLRISAIIFATLLIGFMFAWQYGFLSPDGNRPGASGIAKIGGDFTLTDHTGKTRKSADFNGKLTLIYFGYSFCPDVCPTALQVMSVALDQLGQDAKKIQPLFITVDPARDTVAHLKDYIGNFHPGFVALTGTEQQIKDAARAYRVYFRKAPAEGGNDKDYLMDHSSIVFLMDRDGRYVTHFTHQTPAEKMAEAIRKEL